MRQTGGEESSLLWFHSPNAYRLWRWDLGQNQCKMPATESRSPERVAGI